MMISSSGVVQQRRVRRGVGRSRRIFERPNLPARYALAGRRRDEVRYRTPVPGWAGVVLGNLDTPPIA
jgi:hypothetical protein